MQAGGVEEGDHKNGSEIVDHRQCQQEGANTSRESATEYREHCEGEGDICGHRNTPAAERIRRTALIDCEVEERWNDHPAECCGNR